MNFFLLLLKINKNENKFKNKIMSYLHNKQKNSSKIQSQKYFLSNNNKSQKRVNSQKKNITSKIITQISSSNLYLNNLNSYNNNLNYLHQQAFTPINRRKKLYEDDFLIPAKKSEFNGKKTLVLDLDETLVHSSFLPFAKNDIVLNTNLEGNYYNIYVLVRPWAEQFIKEMGKYFEIITFTASISEYASPVLDILDKEKNIQYRLYREHCNFVNGVFIKDLKRLNRSLKDVIILDNSPLAYAFDVDNGLPILSWFDNRSDKELINIQPILKFLGNVEDVRKYIKKFVRNNCINYENANRIIKDYEENKEIKNNKKEGTLNENNNIENEEEKDQKINNINNNSNVKNTKNNGGLFNNFIIKNDANIPNLINDKIKNNNINSLLKLDNKINNLGNDKKAIKLKLQKNNNLIKSVDLEKKNNNNLVSNINIKNKTNNILHLARNNGNNHNIFPIKNKSNFHDKKSLNNKNELKINSNTMIPMIFPPTSNTSKNNKFLLNNNNKKNMTYSEKMNKKTNKFIKEKNNKNKSIEPLSLKETINYNNNHMQFKYLNLIEKFQENEAKSSSLKIANNIKKDLKMNNIRPSAKYNFNNNSMKNKNKISLKNYLRLSSKPKINNLNIKNKDMNKIVNGDGNKISDIYSQVLRSRSTGSFIKLQSAHQRTPKIIDNKFNANLKWINDEDNKMNFKNS